MASLKDRGKADRGKAGVAFILASSVLFPSELENVRFTLYSDQRSLESDPFTWKVICIVHCRTSRAS